MADFNCFIGTHEESGTVVERFSCVEDQLGPLASLSEKFILAWARTLWTKETSLMSLQLSITSLASLLNLLDKDLAITTWTRWREYLVADAMDMR